jgi:hypothetical protein
MPWLLGLERFKTLGMLELTDYGSVVPRVVPNALTADSAFVLCHRAGCVAVDVLTLLFTRSTVSSRLMQYSSAHFVFLSGQLKIKNSEIRS